MTFETLSECLLLVGFLAVLYTTVTLITVAIVMPIVEHILHMKDYEVEGVSKWQTLNG